MKKTIAIDLSWVMYRSLHSYKLNHEDRPIGHIYGALRDICSLHTQNPDATIYVVTDGSPQRRKELSEGSYKSNRSSNDSYNVHLDTQLITDLATMLPRVKLAHNPFEEADDVLYAIAQKYKQERQVYLFTGDDDLLQTIDTNVYLLRSLRKPYELLDRNYPKNKEKFQVYPEHLPIYRAIVGDASDSIPGVIPRFPRKLARALAQNIKDPQEVLKMRLDPKKNTKSLVAKLELLKERVDVFQNNYELMKLEPVTYTVSEKTLDIELLRKAKVFSLRSYMNYLSKYQTIPEDLLL